MSEAVQLPLLDGNDPRPQWVRELGVRVRALAQRGVFFGTSSWKYTGWLGQLYAAERYTVRGKFSQARFERHCLEEYAEILPSVCGDFAFYQFYRAPFWEKLFAQVPAGFQFGFKAPESITCPRFPRHARYGAQAGLDNRDFLNADLFADAFLQPFEPYRERVGYIVFEFPQFHQPTPSRNAAFLDQLGRFLERLPAGYRFGVELRTRDLLGADYLACLRQHRVAHVLNSWTRMPAIGEQLDQPGIFTADHVIARVLLKPGRSYEQAVAAFQPYNEVKDPYPQGYRDVARLVTIAQRVQPSRRVYVAVNNRFVGNALGAIRAILDEMGPCTDG